MLDPEEIRGHGLPPPRVRAGTIAMIGRRAVRSDARSIAGYELPSAVCRRGLADGRVGHVIGLHLAPLVGRRDDQAQLLQPRQAVDDRRARQPRPPHQLAQADGHAPVGQAAAGLDHHQVDLDRLAPDPGEVAPVEEHALDPVGLGGHRHRDCHGLRLPLRRSTPIDRAALGRSESLPCTARVKHTTKFSREGVDRRGSRGIYCPSSPNTGPIETAGARC